MYALRPSPRSFLALSLLLAAAPCAGQAGSGKKHPPLIAAAEAKCLTCHADVVKGSTTHPGADDCSLCHEVSGGGAQTTVRLTSATPDLCLGCHSDLADAASGKLAAPHAPVADDCANCHRPHAGDVPRLLKAPARDLCLSCHDADGVAKAHAAPLGRADCGTCHAPHGSKTKGMLAGNIVHAPFEARSCDACHQKGRALRARKGKRASQSATCFACHSDLEEKFGRGVVHSPVRDGQCTGCHDPHASLEPKLLKAKGPAACAGCHEGVVGKATAKGGHAPAREACSSCHDPHRSDGPKLLLSSGPDLCASCHDPMEKETRRKHLGADLAKADCSACHDPHGSPGGKLFLARSVHAPFADASCDACHEGGSAAKLAEGGDKGLCTSCHGDVDEAANKAKVKHAALDGPCTACHSPHASNRPKLVRGRGGDACGECHSDKVAGAGEVAHGVIASLGCEACHEPHGGTGAKLLRLPGDALCLACHDGARLKPPAAAKSVSLLGRFEVSAEEAGAIRVVQVGPSGPVNHPVTSHRSSGPPPAKPTRRIETTYQGEMSCLTCHDPHKGKTARLFVKDAATVSENCLQCHPK